MVTQEQMETLSYRVGSMLELVGSLRVENAHLREEIDQVKVRQEQADRKVEENQKEIMRLREQLDERNAKLSQMIGKEEELENFLLQMIGQIEHVRLDAFQEQFTALKKGLAEGTVEDPAASDAPRDPGRVLAVEVAEGVEISEVTVDEAGGETSDEMEVLVMEDGEINQMR